MATKVLTPSGSRESLLNISDQSSPSTPRICRRHSHGSIRSLASAPAERDAEPRVESPVERFGKEKKWGKDDRLQDSKIRERLKTTAWKKDSTDRKSKGPVIAKPNALHLVSTSSSSSSNYSSSPKKHVRTPSPSAENAFSRQVLNRQPVSPCQRRKSNCSARSNSTGRRTPSPNGNESGLSADTASKRVEKALRARLYLLQQSGPNSLLIGGDSPDHKFRIIIGPQTCSCGRGPHCIHILFVMLRVFQVSEHDPLLWRRTLKNFEVDTLFINYNERRKKQCNGDKKVKKSKQRVTEVDRLAETRASQESLLSDRSKDDEEEICPICLLEMIDGESLVKCDQGCQNKLHHHCIAIWFEECKLQGDPLICPLCRTEWSLTTMDNSCSDDVDSLDGTRVQTPDVDDLLDCRLPRAESIPQEHLELAKPWIVVFGEDLVSCLFSRDWNLRETALKHLMQRMNSQLSADARVKPQSQRGQMIECCCNMLSMVCADPVYKVFVAALKTLRSLLGNIICSSYEELEWIQSLLRPIIDTILIKCTDSNRKTSQLSMSTILELAKAQEGELAIGRKVGKSESKGLDGIDFIISCIVQDYPHNSVQWQWLLGRMSMLDKLLDNFPSQFILRQHGRQRQVSSSDSGVTDSCELPSNYHRMMSVLRFALAEVDNSHIRIGKMARRVFIIGSRLTAHVKSVFQEVEQMLSRLEHGLHLRMKKRLAVVANEFTVAQQVTLLVKKEPAYDRDCHVKGNKPPPNSPLTKRRNSLPTNSAKKSQIPVARQQSSLKGSCSKEDLVQNKENVRKNSQTPKSKRVAFSPIKKYSSNPKLNITNEKYIELQDRALYQSGYNHQTISLPASRNQLTGDWSDNPFSPTTPEDKQICFRTEIASPKRNLTKPPLEAIEAFHDRSKLLCKQEIDKEEAEAIVSALEISAQPLDKLPYIHGLSRGPDENVVTIRIQPEPEDEECVDGKITTDSETTGNCLYQENKHWVKGALLGTGAFSSCYQARDTTSGVIVAVKQIAFCRNSDSEQEKVVEAIKAEIDLMTKMNHRNVVRILGATQEGVHFNMFVEWMSGGSVAYLLSKYGAFSEQVVINYTQQVLLGLAYLHDKQMIHRDLKGANLLVDSTGQTVKIADFGAAGRLSAQATMVGEFKGQLLGTIAFMAPEVLRGEDYGRSCDIWSIGCVMIEMVTAKPPWGASDLSNHLALIFKIASATKPPPVPDYVSPPVRDLILRCFEKNPDERPTSKDLLQHSLFTNYKAALSDSHV
ncbi:mitogen-activated protein kinase kinase kinase 1-like [Tubulanus polymorphus]|uniref:mitogen-activated protein kinase kinase kinase 1-like n=1 Tax=Tubulanus polymorphus TaxID=672921 RepID=UPI003DA2A957